MSIKTFWLIFIKILGIWLVLESFTVIPQFVYSFANLGSGIEAVALSVIGLTLTILIYIFILRFFVFKTAWIIDKLQLDKGFIEEKFDFDFQSSGVLVISVIVIGGLMFVDSLPSLCKQVFYLLRENTEQSETSTSGWVIFYLIKTLIGYLLMTNSKVIVKFVHSQKKLDN